MKIACESCSTKYSIDDDKVAGKMFRIRCRKCGQSIVLRGEASAAAAAAAGSGAAWHAVQDGQQIGPFDSGELLRRRAAGEIDDESYVWREGFAGWQPFGSVDELREPAATAAAIAAPLPPPPAAPAPAATSPREAADAARLRGERSETSALFTLDGLAKLAAPSVEPVRAPAPAGATGREGSGLIDIRALARAYAPVTRQIDAVRGPIPAGAGGATAPAPGIGSPADLPVFSSGSFVAASVLVPPVRPRRDRKLVVGLAAALGLLAICATLLVVIVFTRDEQPAAAGEPRPAPGRRIAAIEPAAPRTASPAVVEAPPAPAPQAPAPAPQARTPAPQTRTPASPAAQARTPAPPAAQVRTPAPAPAPASAAGKCDQVTCIVNGDSDCCRALQGGAPLAPTGPAPARSVLPENLDRAAITEGLATISTKRCSGASSATGLVKAHVKVSAAGAVTSVTVESSPDAALSACVSEQAQRGRFKPTQRGGSFSYVWRF
jgi:predicted Zn finger-like uncharacterized protein